MKALYLCSEQYDDDDTKELDALKKEKGKWSAKIRRN